MKKVIWIFNHYATNQYIERNGRHYNLGLNLVKDNYEVIIFCANTIHNSSDMIPVTQNNYTIEIEDGIKFVFIKTCKYQGNGFNRIKNMYLFYKHLFDVSPQFTPPDFIIGSSMHVLACRAALKIKKRYDGCQAIIEMRDLWTESLIGYEKMSKHNPIIIGSYTFEKNLYKKADAVLFTMPGGKEYIKDQGWIKSIGEEKIFYLNNGVNLSIYEKNKQKFQIDDEDLCDPGTIKIIYAGSIRKANCIDKLVNAIEKMDLNLNKKLVFLIYGEGDEKRKLQQYCKEKKLDNIKMKGRVEKKFIPYILSCADLNILNVDSNGLWKYGSSQNKLFDYLAAGKPIFCNAEIGYSILTEFRCGIHAVDDSVEHVQEALKQFFSLSEERRTQMGKNAYMAAEQYDYKRLTEKFENILQVIEKQQRGQDERNR